VEGGDLSVSSIDQRVVQMKFDSATFTANAAAALRTLESLNKALKLQGAAKGLNDIGTAAQKQTGSLKNIENGVSSLVDKFRTLHIVGLGVLTGLAQQAALTGQQFVQSLTLGPIIQGFHEYETNLNAIQTILANTSAAGTNLKQVNAALNELNHYSDQTIYNFSEMAKNIGTFTAAGVGLKPAVAAIKGIANLAALSGSNSEQASAAMYQLSQAISSGRVSLEDWNSVVNAGLGGTVFQRALALNAEKMGTLSKGAVKLKGDMKNVTIEGKSFRESITAKPGQQSWLTSDVLTRTLSQFTGDLSKAQLKAEGFNDAEIKAIQSQAKMAQNAATQVKTFTQLASTLSESVGSGWTQTWQTIFGDFTEARSLFTNVNNVLGGFVSASANARNKVLGDWKQLGGRKAIIDAVANSFNALIAVVKPIGQAFRQMFPSVTGRQLAQFSKDLRDFTAGLTISSKTAENLRRTFAGVFAIFGIGFDIVKQVVKTLFSLVGVALAGSGGFLEFTARIGDWLVQLREAIQKGHALENVFSGIGAVLSVPIKLIKLLATYLGSLFKDTGKKGPGEAVADLSKKLEPLGRLGAIIASVWGKVVSVFDNIGGSFSGFASKVSAFVAKVSPALSKMFEGFNFGDVLKGLNAGLLATLLLSLKKAISGEGIGSLIDKITAPLEGLTSTLSTMQNTLRAATLLQIAASVGILAFAMNTLAKIDAEGLTRAGVAIAAMFTQLITSLLVFEKFSGFTGFAKMPFIATSMILLGVAINILAAAMKTLSTLSWEDLAKGLIGTTVLLGSLVAVGKLMPNPAGMITTATGMVILASAIRILVTAVSSLGGMSWEELAKGLLGVGALLGALTLFARFSQASAAGLLSGVGIVLLATGIKILASAVQDMSGMSWGEIAKGLTTLAGAMAVMVAALAIIPPTAPLGAVAILITAMSLGMVGNALEQLGSLSWAQIGKGLTALLGALTIITAAVTVIPPTAPLGAAAILITAASLAQVGNVLAQLGAMNWSSIGKSLTALAGSMLIISLAVNSMSSALPGAAALLIVSGALAIFAPVLQTLGGMSWGEIGKGLLTLAGAFVVLGVAGAALTPVVPTLLGLGAAIALLGAGLALAGVGVLAFSAGMAALAVTGAAGAAALVAVVSSMLGLLPAVAHQLGVAVVAFAQVIATAGPAITGAMLTVLVSLIAAVNKASPQIIDMFYRLLVAIVRAMAKYQPQMTDAAIRLVIGLINGFSQKLQGVVTAATSLIVAFIGAISKNLPRVIQAGVNLVVNFVNGLADAIRSNSERMGAAGANLGSAIVEGMARGLAGGVGIIASKAREVASSALNAAKSVLGIASPSKEFAKIGAYVVQGFVKGLDGNKSQIDAAFNSLRGQLYSATVDSQKQVASLTDKLEKLQSARHKDVKAIAQTKTALNQARVEQGKYIAAWNEMRLKLTDEQTALGKLATQYDTYTEKIKTAQQALVDATKTRDDYNASVANQYGDIPTANADTTLEDFVGNLQKQVEDTKSLTNTLQRLRELGLNDEIYKDILAAGTSALPFVQQLLNGGKTGIDQVNDLSGQLKEVAGSLGKSASSQLYQVAVDSAQGLVDGLRSQQDAIERQMDKIADAMVKSIKSKLGIRSPSRVFMELGSYSAEGMAQGLDKGSIFVKKSADALSDEAVARLRASLSTLKDSLGREMLDPMPVITPVLDLTNVKKSAGEMGGIFAQSRVGFGSAYLRAQVVAQAVRGDSGNNPANTTPVSAINYTQNNYSPKALSPVEIYRQTNNQLSKVKGAMAPNAN
jgi:tape measure domain-containing protein